MYAIRSYYAGSFIRPDVHEALDHVDVVHRLALGTVDRAFPVPETVRVEVVDSVTVFATNLFFAPDYITHSRPSF